MATQCIYIYTHAVVVVVVVVGAFSNGGVRGNTGLQ